MIDSGSPARQEAINGLREVLLTLEHFRHLIAMQFNLNISDLTALSHLSANTEMGQKQLSGYLGMSTSAVTTLIDRLEARDLVRRRAHPRDRRRAVLCLSAHGEQTMDRIRQRYVLALGRVSDTHVEAAAESLRAVAAALVETDLEAVVA